MKTNRRNRGAALVTTLAMSMVAAALVSASTLMIVSNIARADAERDAAMALNLAEAGINYEIRWISQDTTDVTRPHQKVAVAADGMPGPYTGTMANIDGTFTVYVTTYNAATPEVEGGTWTAPDDLLMTSVGTYNGISRAVRARGIRKSLFDEYALYTDKEGTFGGAGAAATSTMIIGDLGSNGPLTFNGSQGSDTIDGDVNYNGTEITETGDNVYQNPDPVELPTVSEIADSMFTNGLTTLQTDNGNANIKMLFATDAALTSILTRDGITLEDLNLVESTHASALNTATKTYSTGTNTSPLFDSAGFTTASRLLSDAKDPVVAGTSTLDDVPSGTRFVTDEISVVDGEPVFGSAIEGIMGKRVYFVPPGDYYMHDLNLRLGNAAVVLLTHLGSIRFWVDEGGTSNQADRLQTVVVFTSNDPSRFRLFYNKCQDLLIAGGSNFYGGFYAVRDGCSDDTPKLDFTGNTTVYGSVMASYLELGGGTRVIFPNDGAGSDPTDYSLWFGFKDQWREISPDGGDVVFLDNTSK